MTNPTPADRSGTNSPRARMTVNGVVVDLWKHDYAIDRIRRRMATADGYPLAICSINVDHMHHFGEGRLSLSADPAEIGIEWAFLPDGVPVVLRANIATHRRWPRLTGADFLPELLALAEQDGRSVGFLGGMPDVHLALRRELAVRHPQLRVAGYWAPERSTIDSPVESAKLADELSAAGIDMLVVGLGKPRQELWIEQFGARTQAKVLLAFGASADFVARKVQRAPALLQRMGLEWAYRLAKEPRRLGRRYLIQGPPAAMRLTHHVELQPMPDDVSALNPGHE